MLLYIVRILEPYPHARTLLNSRVLTAGCQHKFSTLAVCVLHAYLSRHIQQVSDTRQHVRVLLAQQAVTCCIYSPLSHLLDVFEKL